MKKDEEYLKHIIDTIADIEDSTKNIEKKQFIKNKDTQDANIRRLQIIGEAVKNLSASFKSQNKEIEWSKIAGTRDVIIHKYFDVDLDQVWTMVKEDIPILKSQLKKML